MLEASLQKALEHILQSYKSRNITEETLKI